MSTDPKASLPRTYFAVTVITFWPPNNPGPGFILPDGGRTYCPGFFPLFETRADAEAVAQAFPGAVVMPIPITVGILPSPPKNSEK